MGDKPIMRILPGADVYLAISGAIQVLVMQRQRKKVPALLADLAKLGDSIEVGYHTIQPVLEKYVIIKTQ